MRAIDGEQIQLNVAAHHNTMARNLGQDNTLNHLMTYFYWVGICSAMFAGGVWHDINVSW